MITPARPLFRMFLPQQRQRANALDDVIAKAIIRSPIMHGGAGDRRKAILQAFPSRLQIKSSREQLRQADVPADGDQSLG